jgi:periodic tryptophan protein 1
MEEEEGSDSKINFVPCVTWVRRGVAKPEPERVKLTQEELAAVISQTKVKIINNR